MERPLARGEHVRVVWIQAEVAPAVLVQDAGLRVHDARAEDRGVQRLDEADGVALAVDDGQVDRSASGRVGRWRGRGGAARVDRIGEPCEPPLVEQLGDGDVVRFRIGQMGVPVGDGQLGHLEPRASSAWVRHAVRPERRRRGSVQRSQDAEDLEGQTRPELLGGWVVTRVPR